MCIMLQLKRGAMNAAESAGGSGSRQGQSATFLSGDLVNPLLYRDIFRTFAPLLPPDLQGWNSTTPVLGELVREYRPQIIIDVGVWKGGSTIHFAELLRDNGINGKVIAVDTFLGSVEHHNPAYEGPMQHGRPMLYEQFLSNVVYACVEDFVVPMPQTSANAAVLLEQYSVRADLVHIDASHDEESVLADARAYWKLLKRGGILVGDDYNSGWTSVMRAADRFVAEVGCELRNADPKWIVRKP